MPKWIWDLQLRSTSWNRLVNNVLCVVGWVASSQRMSPSPNSRYLWMWPYLRIVFAGVIKLRFWGQENLGFRVGLKSLTSVFIRERRGGGFKTQRQRSNMQEKAMWCWKQRLEWRMHEQRSTTDCWQPQQDGREARSSFSLEASRKNQLHQHLISDVWSAELWENKVLLL